MTPVSSLKFPKEPRQTPVQVQLRASAVRGEDTSPSSIHPSREKSEMLIRKGPRGTATHLHSLVFPANGVVIFSLLITVVDKLV